MKSEPAIKFLLVDDLEANLLALEGLLQRAGLEVLKASSGPEALELLLIHEVALAFLDVQMPGMDGFELAEMMRSTERTRRVPIIFLTAGIVDQQRRIRGYETGAVDFLFKPIDPHILLNKANIFFELASQRNELKASQRLLQSANQQLAKRIEELAQADRNKDEFLAMLAHELRNPLAPLRNAGEILQMEKSTGEDRAQAVQIIDRQTENMSRMLDDLLDVSRITEGKIELRKQVVSLHDLLTSAAQLVGPQARAQGQTLTLSLPEQPVMLDADSTRLDQVFGNLLGNAIKYSGAGRNIWVSARLTGDSTDTPEVVISVRDDGAGIEPTLLPRIFDLFVQATRALDRRHGGLGIGLTLVNRLVKLHGGHVEARSDGPGHGSEFLVHLPVMRDAPVQTVQPSSDTPSGSRRILIVDDNEDAARSLATLHKRHGHVTETAFTGPAAIVAAAEFLPEVVLLDIGLPGIDGYEVARQLRAVPHLSHVRLIAMSGYGSEKDRERAQQAGFDEYLVKPLDLAKLRALLQDPVKDPFQTA